MKKFYKTILSLLLIGLFLTKMAEAQTLTNDNVNITISSGFQITVKGDIQNQNGGFITNSGSIDLSGNWTNNAANNVFGTSTGTVILNGGSQTFGGTNPTLFNNLVLQGPGVKTLTQNVSTGGGNATPAGVLNLLTRLDLNSKTLSVTNSATNAITGTGRILSEKTDNSSKVKWTINNTTGAHVIPFENAATADIPFIFNLASGNAGDITVSTYVTSAANLPLPIIPVSVSNINDRFGANNSSKMVDRFWQVDATGTPSASLTFTWGPTENAASGNTNPMAQRWANATTGWDLPLVGQSNPTAQSVVVNNVSSFGPWAITLTSSPLPVELLTFNANLNSDHKVDLFWVTASEINNDYFTMERSADGITFESIGTVEGAGNSTATSNYKESDKNPYKGISYYRLKQTDFDGKFSYSQIVKVNLTEVSNAMVNMNIYPNPAIDHVNIQVSDEKLNPNTKVEILNAVGQVVFNSSIVNLNTNGNNVYKVNTGHFSPGFYMVRMINGNEIIASQKLIKK